MRKNKELTIEQKVYIRANYPDMTIFDLTQKLKISTSRIGRFLKENNLNLSNGEAKRYHREKKNKVSTTIVMIEKPMDKPNVKWVSRPWDRGLNLVTMQTSI